MKTTLSPFVQSFIYALLVALLISIMQVTQLSHWLHPYIWLIFLFLFFLSIGTTGLTVLLSQHSPKRFRSNYLLVITIRLMIAMFILAYAVYMQVGDLKIFSINYFIIYMSFVIFEIFTLKMNTGKRG